MILEARGTGSDVDIIIDWWKTGERISGALCIMLKDSPIPAKPTAKGKNVVAIARVGAMIFVSMVMQIILDSLKHFVRAQVL